MIENSNAAKQTPEFRARMSRSQKERMKDPAVRARMRESGKKAWEDPARHAEYAERTKLQLQTDGHPMKGKKHSAESKKKMSEAHKNMSPETKRRISRSQKKRFEDPKERGKSRKRQTERMRDPRVRESALDGLRKARSAVKDTLPEKCVQYILGELLDVDYKTQYKADRGNGRYYAIDAFVEPNIAIEVDGAFWHSAPGFESGIRGGRSSSEVRKINERRDRNLRELGYKVVHVSDLDLKNNMSGIIEILAEVCDARLPVEADVYYGDVARKAVEYEANLRKERQQKRSVATRDRRNARNRERWRTDPEYQAKHKAAAKAYQPKANAARRAKYASDPAYRIKISEQRKDAYNNAPPEQVAKRTVARRANYQENRSQIRAKQNAKYANDEAFRERQKARSALRSKTHKDEISRKNKERHGNMTPEEKAEWSANRHEYYMNNRTQIREQRKEKRKNLEFLAREKAQHKAYRENNSEKIKSRKSEAYKKQKLQNAAAIVAELDARCFKCGRKSPDMLVGADMEAARADGHVHKRGSAWKYYVNHPDEARKYLRLACPDCKDWHGGAKRA